VEKSSLSLSLSLSVAGRRGDAAAAAADLDFWSLFLITQQRSGGTLSPKPSSRFTLNFVITFSFNKCCQGNEHVKMKTAMRINEISTVKQRPGRKSKSSLFLTRRQGNCRFYFSVFAQHQSAPPCVDAKNIKLFQFQKKKKNFSVVSTLLYISFAQHIQNSLKYKIAPQPWGNYKTFFIGSIPLEQEYANCTRCWQGSNNLDQIFMAIRLAHGIIKTVGKSTVSPFLRDLRAFWKWNFEIL
jgi:hypothetical protein